MTDRKTKKSQDRRMRAERKLEEKNRRAARTKQFQRHPERFRRIVLGQTDTSEPATIQLQPKDTLREVIVGPPGYGKTTLMLSQLQQINTWYPRPSIAVIDCKDRGDLYNASLAHFASRNQLERVYYFDPASDHYPGWNPFETAHMRPEDRAYAALDVKLQAWGQTHTDQTPRLRRWLFRADYASILQGLTPVESALLLDFEQQKNLVREAVMSQIPENLLREKFRTIHSLRSMAQRGDQLESSFSRYEAFVQYPAVRSMVTRDSEKISFAQLLQEGKHFLAHLPTRRGMSKDNVRLLGRMFIEGILQACSMADHPRDLILFVDEAHQIMSEDFSDILNTARSSRVHLILGFQDLSQVETVSETLLRAVLSATNVMCIFGGLDTYSMNLIVDPLVHMDYRYNEAKHVQRQLFFDPVEAMLEEITRRSSERRSIREVDNSHISVIRKYTGRNTSRWGGDTRTISTGETIPSHGLLDVPDVTEHRGEALTNQVSPTKEESSERTIEIHEETPRKEKVYEHLEEESQTLRTGTRYEENIRESGRQLYTLEEQRTRKISEVHLLPHYHCAFTMYNEPTKFISVKNPYPVEATEAQLRNIQDWISEKQPGYLTVDESLAQEKERHKRLVDKYVQERDDEQKLTDEELFKGELPE